MTIGGLVVAGIMLVFALFTRKKWLANFTLGGVAVWFAFYAVMLFGFSFASSEKTLAVNEPKAFCGFYLDCHMHTAVTGVRTAGKIGDQTANGLFYVVTVKVFSDAKNPAIAFRLLEPSLVIRDGSNSSYNRNEVVEKLLPSAVVELGGDIRGGDTIEKEVVFDLPVDVKEPKLDIKEGYGVDHVIEAILVDDEDSILHKRSYFQIREQIESVGVK
jgi:hypothetical protein